MRDFVSVPEPTGEPLTVGVLKAIAGAGLPVAGFGAACEAGCPPDDTAVVLVGDGTITADMVKETETSTGLSIFPVRKMSDLGDALAMASTIATAVLVIPVGGADVDEVHREIQNSGAAALLAPKVE